MKRLPQSSTLITASAGRSSVRVTLSRSGLFFTTFAWMLTLMFSANVRAESQPTIDELLNLKPPTTQPAPNKHRPDDAGVPVDPEVAQRLSLTEAADLFHEAIGQMSEASDRLGQVDPGLDTQRIQLAVLSKLDQVIASVEQNSSPPPSSSSSQRPPDNGSDQNQQAQSQSPSQQQANQQSTSSGKAPMGQRDANPDKPIDSTRTEWGNLPPRLREELQQGLGERFSPVYQELTEQYYKRLAEEER
ncbi:MAG: hypothetical protein IT444_01250 [Phycisphaeraceae bacterium]|nr:hypothetical protein [Phycisphaeraceae bacterium]